MFKKVASVILSLVMVISFVTPSLHASANESQELGVTKKEVENTGILVDSINELDQKLDMENLSSNSQGEINKLSKEARELYNAIVSYEDQKSTPLTGDDTLTVLSSHINKLNSGINKIEEPTVKPMGVINYKEYKISNSKIQKLVKAAGLNGGFWATATAIAKVFGKSPTALTLMLGAVPVLGVSGLNMCNSKNKGVIITKIGSGATNSYSCRSQ
ncbi:hypothetical protein M948_20670 [Virgibacillus sp. CM-4]|uniref:hypothetical protein n=1 Tax=Virgibacillus sp. CM-4 TaxID=1354277 RepID=UPI000388687C|nr:hypothetical protein [Virgibacillus sp. CM-4]EQB34797.1 hypothetical protein M948_20670 [Virgibacillus sp. CM-4]